MRSDSAASFRRMLADGMPRTGLVVAGRSMALQSKLYKLYKAGKGNLAAFPNKRAPHIMGVAFDASRKTAMQRWLVKGGAMMSNSASEHIRANEYGFYRNVLVPGHHEPWHFRYFPEHDKHRVAAIKYPTLKNGSKGAWVTALQKKLGVKATGTFTLTTYRAVRTYQKGHGLKVDGIAGRNTLKKLGIKPA